MWRPGGVERSTGIYIAVVAVSLALVTFDLRASGAGIGDTLRDGTQAVFTPVQEVVDSVTSPVVGFFEAISDAVGLRDENRQLRDRIAELEAQLQDTVAIEVRVEELERILDVAPPEELDAITAQVLAVGVSEFDFIRVIDKGSSDGVGVDMPVIDEGGLVGRVVSATGGSARVRLITDPTFRIAVRVERTGETGVLTGRGSGRMILEMFNTDASLVEGDLLVTADGRFPAGISVARVAEPARAEVGFALRTSAVPTAAVTRVDFVRILVFTADEAGVEDLTEEDQPVDVPIEQGEQSEGEPDVAPGEPVTTTEP
jgi:rod shape-determining protein MreC